jgi:hypothetical protein
MGTSNNETAPERSVFGKKRGLAALEKREQDNSSSKGNSWTVSYPQPVREKQPSVTKDPTKRRQVYEHGPEVADGEPCADGHLTAPPAMQLA